MSRLRSSGHKKSQSTSALSMLTSPSSSSSSSPGLSAQPRLRASQHPALDRVDEMPSSGSASLAHLSGLMTPGADKKQNASRKVGVEEVKGWLNDINSLRSSDRRRSEALKNLEMTLFRCCDRMEEKGKVPDPASDQGITLAEFLGLRVHSPLISLLARHAQSCASQPSSETTGPLVFEIYSLVGMLQGLSLLGSGCKAAVGEPWVIEIFVDLLLQLRAYPPTREDAKPIAYSILELLFCVLVDSPVNARTFERLSGLETVVKVLKGTGVVKDVRMKCIEFLYFYLLPEQTAIRRAVSSTSTSSSSSGGSNLFPPSPLSSSTSLNGSNDRLSPSSAPFLQISKPISTYADIDIPFVPQTPKKPPLPSTGYLTPSITRRVSGSTLATPSLHTTPSPPKAAASQWSRQLAALAKPPEKMPSPRRRETRNDVQRSKSAYVDEMPVGLGFGLPKSTSISGGLDSASSSTRGSHPSARTGDYPETKPLTPTFSDPFSAESRSSSSGSSTVYASPHSANPSRSSTPPSLAVIESSPHHLITRQPSARRMSKSPLEQSLTLEQSVWPDANVKPETTPRLSKHSRAQSHMSVLPSIPASPQTTEHQRRHSLAPPSESGELQRSPSFRPSRAFPSELTRGLPSSASSPNLASPLGNSKRIPSDKRPIPSKGPMPKRDRLGKDVRSVEEKKELVSLIHRQGSVNTLTYQLGSWLGNVDTLVQDVEKVGIWGWDGKGHGH